jgi:hypothetical protein
MRNGELTADTNEANRNRGAAVSARSAVDDWCLQRLSRMNE